MERMTDQGKHADFHGQIAAMHRIHADLLKRESEIHAEKAKDHEGLQGSHEHLGGFLKALKKLGKGEDS